MAEDYKIRSQLKHRFHPQWRDLFLGMLDQFDDQQKIADFMRSAGARIAKAADLGETRSLKDLEHALNAYFLETEWGWVVIDEREDYLWLRHGGFPAMGVEMAAPERAMIHVLEGFYTELLNRLASTSDFTARCGEYPGTSFETVNIAYGDH